VEPNTIKQGAVRGQAFLSKLELRRHIWNALHKEPAVLREPLVQHPPHDRELVVVAGGPSTAKHYPKIAEFYEQGKDIICVNGMYDILTDMGVIPKYMLVVDPRSKHAKYLKEPDPRTTFLIASQCHQEVFDALRDHKVLVWHVDLDNGEIPLLEATGSPFSLLKCGCTAGLAAITVPYLLGYRKYHVFGLDGSLADDGRSHAYDNEIKEVYDFKLAGKTYKGTAWMIMQHQDFQNICRNLQGVQLAMYGEGIIPDTWEIMCSQMEENASNV